MERRYVGVADTAIYLDMAERWMYRRVPTSRDLQVLLRALAPGGPVPGRTAGAPGTVSAGGTAVLARQARRP
ncbi:hypothetical protein AB0H45_28960 [Streptomyces atroolivaceus]|uniref:hypothetical protein n=1 Tax=Streptomyces atroolivaceus TaxID=66869 RepID=UPI003406B086